MTKGQQSPNIPAVSRTIYNPLSIKLAKAFANIFVIDCTYKTNKYKMPLLDIIGVSCFNTSFYSSFVFLERENEESYSWILSTFKKILGEENRPHVIMSDTELTLMNDLRNIFPTTTNLLCVWHIEKNILAICKMYFKSAKEFDIFMLSWKNVVYSTTGTVFEKNWDELELFYKDKKQATEYIKNTWLPWKERFVSAWTKKYLHFDNLSSSRAEGAHAKLKMYIQVSTGGLQDVKHKICLAIEHEFNEIKVKHASERIRVLHLCNTPVSRELLSRVSHFALKEIYKQYEKIKDDTMISCTNHFKATMDFLCAYVIKYCHGTTLSLDFVHPQWRIDTLSLNSEDDSNIDEANKFMNLLTELYSKYQVWPINKKEFATSMITKLMNQSEMFFEPIIQRPKGRPPKSKKKRGTTSTRRDPSKFELVELSGIRDPSSSTCAFQRSGDMAGEINNMHHESSFIDLNMLPDISNDFTSLD